MVHFAKKAFSDLVNGGRQEHVRCGSKFCKTLQPAMQLRNHNCLARLRIPDRHLGHLIPTRSFNKFRVADDKMEAPVPPRTDGSPERIDPTMLGFPAPPWPSPQALPSHRVVQTWLFLSEFLGLPPRRLFPSRENNTSAQMSCSTVLPGMTETVQVDAPATRLWRPS